MTFRNTILNIALAAAVSLLLPGCAKDCAPGGDFLLEFPDLPAVTIEGAVVDQADGSTIPGIEVTMTSYASPDSDIIKDRKTVVTDEDGWYVVTLEYNDKEDFFRISAKDPMGVYATSGIDYKGWNGRYNYIGNQFVYMSKK